jgi:CO dehydrogenase maturation factor
MFVVSDPTRRGIETAEMIKNLAGSLQINFNQIYLVLNKVPDDERVKGILKEGIRDSKIPLAGVIPEDENIHEYDLIGKPIIELSDDSKAVVVMNQILQRIFA